MVSQSTRFNPSCALGVFGERVGSSVEAMFIEDDEGRFRRQYLLRDANNRAFGLGSFDEQPTTSCFFAFLASTKREKEDELWYVVYVTFMQYGQTLIPFTM